MINHGAQFIMHTDELILFQEGFSIDGTDDNVDYGKVLIFIQENRLHQVGITANQVRKRLEAEGKLKDLEIAKREEEKKEAIEKPNRISNLLKLYTRTIALTKKKPDPKKEDEDKKDDGTKQDDGDESKGDEKDEVKKDVSNDKSSPSKEVSTPQSDSPKAEDSKPSEEGNKTGETKTKSADTMKKLGSLFRFFNKPPGKDEKPDPSEQVDAEDADAAEEPKIKDEETDKVSPADDDTTSQAEPSKDPTTESEESSDKATENLNGGEKKDVETGKAAEDAEKVKKPSRDVNESPKKADTDLKTSVVKPSTDPDKSMKDEKKADFVKEKEPLGEDKKEADADKKTPEKVEGLLAAENKLSSLIGSDQAGDEKGSHIEEFIPDDDDEMLDSPKDSPENKLEEDEKSLKTENDKNSKVEEASEKLKQAMSLLGDDDTNESADKLDDKETVALTKKKPDPTKEDEDKKDGGTKPDDGDESKEDEKDDAKKGGSDDKSSPSKEVSTPQSDSPKAEDGKPSDATEEDNKTGETKTRSEDTMKKLSSLFRFFNKPPGKDEKPDPSEQVDAEDADAAEEPKIKDEEADKEKHDGDDNVTRVDKGSGEQLKKTSDHPSPEAENKEMDGVNSDFLPHDKSKDANDKEVTKGENNKEGDLIRIDDDDDGPAEASKPRLSADKSADGRATPGKDDLSASGKPNELDLVKGKDDNKVTNDSKKQASPAIPEGESKSDVNKEASKDKVNEDTKTPEPQAGDKLTSSGKSGTAEDPKNKSLSADADAIETLIDLNPPENEEGGKTGNDESGLNNDLKELIDLKPSEDSADDKKATLKERTIKGNDGIESLEPKDEDKAPAVDSDPAKVQKPEDESLLSLKENLDPSKKKSDAEEAKDKSAAIEISKEAQEKEQKPKQEPTKATPIRKGSTVKISDKTTTIEATTKPEKAKSSEKLKVPEKSKPKEIVKAASSDRIKDSSKTSSAEKLRSTEKLMDSNKDKVPEKLSGRSKSSDKLRSSEKLRDKELSTKRRSLQPSTLNGVKDLKTGRPRSISLRPETRSIKKKVPEDKKEMSKERQQNQGETMGKKTPSAEWRKSGKKGGSNDVLTGNCDDREPCDEKRIKPRRKHRRQVTELVEIDNALVLRTQESYTSDDDEDISEDPTKIENLENVNLKPPSKSSATPKSSKAKQNESTDLSEPIKNALRKDTDSNKKPSGKRQSRTSNAAEEVPLNSSKSATGTKNRPLSPERETKRKKAGKQYARDGVANQDPFYSNWREGDGATEVRLDSRKRRSDLLDGSVSDLDSSLGEEWFDTKSHVSTDWYDAKSQISGGDPYQEWDAYSSMPPFPGYTKTQRYADPRLACMDSVDNSYYNRSIRNSRIPVPSRGHNSANVSPYSENKTLLGLSPTRYLDDKHGNSRSRSKSPIKPQEERLSWTPGESSRKRPPMKSVINKPLNLGQKEFSNISCLKMDKSRAETLKALRPAHLKTDNQMPLSRIQSYLKPVHNYDDTNDRLFRPEQQIPYIRFSEDRGRNPSGEAFRRPRCYSSSYKRASPSPTRQDQKRYSPQPPPSPYRGRPVFDDMQQRTRQSQNDLVDELPQGTYLLDPRSLCPQNICRSRCTCLSRSADDLADFSNSSSILKMTFVPPNRKPPWRI